MRIACLLMVAVPLGCAGSTRANPDWLASGEHAMVASDSAYASAAGVEILRAGGNAFDAAVAVSFALAVTRPQSTGLGGGGFLIARTARDGQFIVSDFRETAPAAATADMFTRARAADPDGPTPSRTGHLAVAVPGLLAGRARTLERHGTMSLAEVLAPAIRLARNGFPVDGHYVDACEDVLEIYRDHPGLIESCPYVYRTHLREGDLRQPGDALVQPELARLLERIAADGPDVFYRGPVAQDIEREVQSHGGVLRAADLASYRVVHTRKPITSRYRDYTVVSMPPPSSGGICVTETLNILKHFDLPQVWKRDRPLARHYLIEAMKNAFADRARWLGDSDFVSVPVGLLTSDAYASQLARGIEPDQTQTPDMYGVTQVPDDAGTSHFCIVDPWGNCVVSTETINTSFGSLAAVGEWGLILNNEMDDFSAEPQRANAFGLTQSQRNAVAPGKRPLSSMSPTIVLRDGKPVLLLGGSGGPRIISSVLNVLLDVTDFGMSLPEAMTARRVHHQWLPDEVVFDEDPPADVAASLHTRGHRISEKTRTGIIQVIQIDGSRRIGAADPRKGGRPAGY